MTKHVVACWTEKATNFSSLVVVIDNQWVVLKGSVRNVITVGTADGTGVILLLSKFFYVTYGNTIAISSHEVRPTFIAVGTPLT